jgi:hypothetical protein
LLGEEVLVVKGYRRDERGISRFVETFAKSWGISARLVSAWKIK